MSTVVSVQTLTDTDNCGFAKHELNMLWQAIYNELYVTEVRCITRVDVISRGKDEKLGNYAVFMIECTMGHWLEIFSATVYFECSGYDEIVCLSR